MKKITTFLGCVGVVCLFWGCSSSEDILDPNAAFADDEEIVSSESGDTPTSSSSSASKPTSSDAKQNPQKDPAPSYSDSVVVDHDTVTKQVVIIQDADLGSVPTPNYSSGVFCWSEECKTKYAGQTANPNLQSSSSMVIDIGMSVEQPVYPKIEGDKMTDLRDNQTYKLITIGGTRWTDSNIKFKPTKGFYCEDGEGEDVCAKYGVFYSYGAAQSACPSGWRLPTQAEVEAADAVQPHEWWTIGGRFKLDESGNATEYGLSDGQGYIWIVQNDSYSSWRVKDYSDDDKEHAFQKSEGPRAYNVRCVQGE